MTMIARLDTGAEFQVATNVGWMDAIRWTEGLPVEYFLAVRQLADHGWYDPFVDVIRQVERALETTPPRTSVEKTVRGLVNFLKANPDAEAVVISDGVTDDEEDEPESDDESEGEPPAKGWANDPFDVGGLPIVAKDMPPYDRHEEDNTYHLPDGEEIEADLRRFFEAQMAAVLGVMSDQGEPLPANMPDMGVWNEPMERAMTPTIGVYWDQAGRKMQTQLGLDPNDWKVTDPHTRAMIRRATLNFCAATNATTTDNLGRALDRLREQLIEGIVTEGESLPELTKRVQSVFENAEKFRARRIAITEASRAVHAAGEESARQSGVVVGIKLLLSANSCPLCHEIAEKCPQVRLGDNFAVIGDHPDYKDIPFPPIHPGCRCSTTQILHEDYGGPANPIFYPPLGQPKPPKEDREERPKKPAAPKKPPKPPAPIATPAKPVVAPKPPPATPRTISERLGDYKEGDRKVESLAKIQSDVAAKEKVWRDAFQKHKDFIKEHDVTTWSHPDIIEQGHVLNDDAWEKMAAYTQAQNDSRGKALEVIHANPAQQMKIVSPQQRSNPVADLVGPLRNEADKALNFIKNTIATGPKGAGSSVLGFDAELIPADVDKRAHAERYKVFLNTTTPAKVIAHEIGHTIEFQHASKSAHEFLDYRVGSETPVNLAKKFPNSDYKANEFGRKDKFDSVFSEENAYYVGKKYTKIKATEIVSMGVQKLYEDPIGFAAKDPEFCKFILGVLDGSIRG
jgi:hypothetical protein